VSCVERIINDFQATNVHLIKKRNTEPDAVRSIDWTSVEQALEREIQFPIEFESLTFPNRSQMIMSDPHSNLRGVEVMRYLATSSQMIGN
jgi:hypothetical protein